MASALVQEAQDVKAEMSFAPMIDCVFQLLIFFLVCSKIRQAEEHLSVYLPDEGKSTRLREPDTAAEPVYVLVRDNDRLRSSPEILCRYGRNATYYINSTDGQAYTDINQLREALKRMIRDPKTKLIIYPADERTHKDQETPWKNVLAVVDAGYWAGYSNIQFRPPVVYW